MAKKKSRFLSSFGIAFQVLKSVTDAVLAEGGSDDDLRSLLSDPEKRRRVALEIVGRGPVVQDGSPDHYRIHVSYAKLPPIAELEKKFSGKNSVSRLFDGREWERHSSCAAIDETPGERNFRVAEIPAELLGKRIEDVWNELDAHFDREGYRFAIETEAVEFANAKPELQRKNWILARGSSALDGGVIRYVAVLGSRGRGRVLDGRWVGCVLLDDARLLLVRKASSAL